MATATPILPFAGADNLRSAEVTMPVPRQGARPVGILGNETAARATPAAAELERNSLRFMAHSFLLLSWVQAHFRLECSEDTDLCVDSGAAFSEAARGCSEVREL